MSTLPPVPVPDSGAERAPDVIDPCHGAGSTWYERRKRSLAVAVLPEQHYRRALEPGCGSGRLTVLLADRCDEVVSWDADPAAVERARRRTAGCSNVTVSCASSPEFWPARSADLIVLSEIGYHLSPTDLDAVLDRCAACLEPRGSIVAVHWRHPTERYPMGGDDVHARLFTRREWERIGGYADDDVRIDVFDRVPPPGRAVSTRGL